MNENDIKYYEREGSPIKQVWDAWKAETTETIETTRLVPKWKWFKPPMHIKIFKWEISMMWAYTTEKVTESESNGFDILYNQVEPRWKWFKPPMSVTLFDCFELSMMWAYRIKKSIHFKDCYPVGIGGDFTMEKSGIDRTIEFEANPIPKNEKVQKVADMMLDQIHQLEKESKKGSDTGNDN